MYGPWIVILMMILAGLPRNTHRELYQPVPPSANHGKTLAAKPAVGKTSLVKNKDFNSMRLVNAVELHRYTYKFEGRATRHGKPCSSASVTVRVVTPRLSMTHGAITDDDGKYAIEMTLMGAESDPIDWSMEAFTPDFEKVELVGRRILTQEEEVVTVEAPVKFVVAQSVPAR